MKKGINPIGLLIAVIITALLLYVFLQLWMKYQPNQNIQEKIQTALNRNETEEGKSAYLGKINYIKEESLNAKNLDSGIRSVNFKCNSSLCLENTKNNNRIIIFKENIQLETTTRCIEEKQFFLCTVYFGKKPAQIELVSEKIEQKNSIIAMELELTNSGETETKPITIDAFLKRIEEKEERIIENKFSETEKIGIRENKKISLELNPKQNGEHKIEIIISGEDNGKISIAKNINVQMKTENKCETGQIESFSQYSYENQNCEKKYYCSNCEFAFECKQAWEKKLEKENKKLIEKTTAYSIEVISAVNGGCS